MAEDTETAELTDINGVGDATAGRFEETDYDSVDALVGADPEDVADEVDYIDEDDASDFIEQAEELTGGESEDESDTSEEDEPVVGDTTLDGDESEGDVSIETPTDADDEADEDQQTTEEKVPDPNAGDLETYQLEFTVEGEQYDYVVAALVSVKIGKTNVSSSMASAADNVLTDLREMEGGGTFIGDLTEQELNTLHAALTQAVARYRGGGNTGPFQAVNSVLEDVEEARQRYLFS